MHKGRGKGRISNNLVAASCAAVLAIYAAGYWRTRDAARQFEAQAKGRRPTTRTERAAISPKPAVIEPSAPATQPPPQAPATIAPAVVVVAEPPSRVVAPKITHAPISTTTASAPPPAAAGFVVAPIPMPSELAAAPVPAPGPAATPAARWRDGVYTGHGDSPHGDLDVRVVIKDGRIVEAAIESCNTRYPCELLNPMVKQAVVIQSSDVDYVSRATESSQAYNDGLVEALNKALYPPPGKETTSQ